MKQLFFLAVVLLCFIQLQAQPMPVELQRNIGGKKNLKAIMQEVEEYYDKEEEEEKPNTRGLNNAGKEEDEFESSLLFWKRWEYYNKTRLQANGDLEDISTKTITAWDKINAKFNGVSLQSGSDATWNFVGPYNLQYQDGFYRGLCRIDKIVFDPSNQNIIYAGANNGGLWRTVDGGNNWSIINFYFPIQSASGVVINPANPNNIFILTGDGNTGGIVQNSCGIWVTNDGGGNWFKTGFNSDPKTSVYNGFKLVMMPGTSYVLFAATQSGLYRSGDAGSTWTKAINAAPIYDVEFDPSQPGRVYASGNGTFYLSENFGIAGSFNQQTVIPGATRIEIGVSPANSNYVYLLCGPYTGAINVVPPTNPPTKTFVGTSKFAGIYRSKTGGTANSFTLQANSPNVLCATTTGIVAPNDAGDQSGYDLAIDVDKTNAEIITVGAKAVWRSANGGVTLTALTLFNEGNTNAVPPSNYIHPDIHEIAYNPLNNYLYAGTDGGIYRSTNGGTVWLNLTNGIHTSTFYHMAGAPFDANRILGGTQDNGVKYKSNAGDFTHIAGADGFDCAFGPSSQSPVYATINASFQRFDITGVFQGGNNPNNLAFFPVIAADPVTNNIVYLAGGADTKGVVCGVQKSIDGGNTWTQILKQNIQQSICTCPNNSNRVYVTGTGSIFRTDDGGTSWALNLQGNPGFINNGQITDINNCSGNSDYVYVTLGGYTAGQKVMYSNNAGATWLNISGTLPAEVKVNCVAVDQFNNAYIGTDAGVYYQAVASADWTPFYNQLPRVPITDLAINQGTGKIRAATYGHGIWETALFTSCDINFTMPATIAGNKFYQASNFISATSSIVGGNNTIVTARAGGEVYLGPNFTVYEGNVFNGILGACESGPVPQSAGRAADVPPVFISSADKGNNTTLFAYGFIVITKDAKNQVHATINAVQSGDFLLTVTDKTGVSDLIHITEKIEAGTAKNELLATETFTKGNYYVQLYFEGKLVHVQEMIF